MIAEFAITIISKPDKYAIFRCKIKMPGYRLTNGPVALFFFKTSKYADISSQAELCRLGNNRFKKMYAKNFYEGLFFQAVKLLCNDKKKITGCQLPVSGNRNRY